MARGVAAAVVLLAACADRRARDADTTRAGAAVAPAAAAVHIRREHDYALDPGAAPFHFVLDAAGPTVDSLDVSLEIRSRGDPSVYRRRWSSAGYLECECDESERPAQLPGLRADARRYLETFFDSAFVAPAPDSGRYWEQPDHRTSVFLYLVPQLVSASRLGDTTALLDSIRAERQTSYDALADRVRAGIRRRPAFVYRTSTEVYCIAAWVPEVGKVVDVLCGP